MIIGVDPMALADFAAALAKRLPEGLALIRVGDFSSLAHSEEPGLLLGASFWSESRRTAFGKVLSPNTKNHPLTTLDHGDLMNELREQGLLGRSVWPVRIAPSDIPLPVSIAFHLPVQTQVTAPLETRADLNDALMQMVLSGIEPNCISLLGPEDHVESRWSLLLAPHGHFAWPDSMEASEPPCNVAHFAEEIIGRAGLDVARIDVGLVNGIPKLWRVDDRPAALLPPAGVLNEPFAHWLSGIALGAGRP